MYFLIPQIEHHDITWEAIFKVEKTWKSQISIGQDFIIRPIEEKHYQYLSDINKLNAFAKRWSEKLFKEFPEFRKFLRVDLGADKARRDWILEDREPGFENSINDERWIGSSLVIIPSPPKSKFKGMKIYTCFLMSELSEPNSDVIPYASEDITIDVGIYHRHFADNPELKSNGNPDDNYESDEFDDAVDFIRRIINDELVIIYSQNSKKDLRSATELYISKGENLFTTSWNGTYNSKE